MITGIQVKLIKYFWRRREELDYAKKNGGQAHAERALKRAADRLLSTGWTGPIPSLDEAERRRGFLEVA